MVPQTAAELPSKEPVQGCGHVASGARQAGQRLEGTEPAEEKQKQDCGDAQSCGLRQAPIHRSGRCR